MAVKKKNIKQVKKTTYTVLIGGYTAKKDAVEVLIKMQKKNLNASLIILKSIFYLSVGKFEHEDAANECILALSNAGFDGAKIIEE